MQEGGERKEGETGGREGWRERDCMREGRCVGGRGERAAREETSKGKGVF